MRSPSELVERARARAGCNLLKFHRDFPREAAREGKSTVERNALLPALPDNLAARIIEHVSRKSFSVYAGKPINSNLISAKSPHEPRARTNHAVRFRRGFLSREGPAETNRRGSERVRRDLATRRPHRKPAKSGPFESYSRIIIGAFGLSPRSSGRLPSLRSSRFFLGYDCFTPTGLSRSHHNRIEDSLQPAVSPRVIENLRSA